MNPDKRYCLNRAAKKKRKSAVENWSVINNEASSTSIEEERQFKLGRFVEDVNKFVQEKERSLEPVTTRRRSKETRTALQKPNKTVALPSKPMAKMGLFRNGVQTKMYTRGLMGKEMTARLDEDLHQIIALANNNKENVCGCSHKKWKSPVLQPTASTTREPLHTLTARSNTPPERLQAEESKATRLAQLYPEFTRMVCNSAVKSMTTHFPGISYSAEKKKELLGVYLRAQGDTQESAGLSETQKSDVATSPLRSPLTLTPSSSTSRHNGSKPTFDVNFVPEPSKSFKQILEETTGSGSSFQNLFLPLEPREDLQPSPPKHTRRYRSDEFSSVPSFFISPLVQNSLSGLQRRRQRNRFSSLLPPIEEESPEFQYYPHFLY